MTFKVCFYFWLVSLIVLTGFSPVDAADTDRHSYYVTIETLPPQLLVPPPAEKSVAWQRNIKVVITAQQHLSKNDLAAMRNEQHVRLDLVTGVLGPNFTRASKPKIFALLDRVLNDASIITEADKQFWHTRRPYLADRHIRLLVDPIDSSPAYPSGHTSETRVVAEVLGLLYPEKLDTLRQRADDIAWRRIEAGVHYPADINAGRMLAMLIVGALLENDAFRDDLAAAREEIIPR